MEITELIFNWKELKRLNEHSTLKNRIRATSVYLELQIWLGFEERQQPLEQYGALIRKLWTIVNITALKLKIQMK